MFVGPLFTDCTAPFIPLANFILAAICERGQHILLCADTTTGYSLLLHRKTMVEVQLQLMLNLQSVIRVSQAFLI